MDYIKQHALWLFESRKKMLEIIKSAKANKSFYWCGRNYDKDMVGALFLYETGRDLTASILEWWLNHEAGDVPPFYLKDIADATGDLWDKEVLKVVYPMPSSDSGSPAHS